MPFYTKRMVRFLEGKEGKGGKGGKEGKKSKKSGTEKGLRVAPSSVGTGGKSAATSGVKQPEVLTTAPAEAIPDMAFDQKKLLFMKQNLKASLERINKEKGAFPQKHRYFQRYTVMADEGPIAETPRCKVFKAQHNDFKENLLVCKTYEGEHGIDPNNSLFLKILRVLGKKHPNIIQTWDMFISDNNAILIFQELANKGSLPKHLEQSTVDEQQVGRWCWQVFKGLDYLGDIGVSHRAIQPKHVLLSHKDLRVKLTGFENAATYWDVQKEDIANVPCVPLDQRPADEPSYQAPEVYGDPSKEEFDPLVADVWSFGATFYYMLTKAYPYDISSPDPNIGPVIQANIQQIQGLSADGKRLMAEMLTPLATERKHIDKLATDSWLKAFK